MLVYALRSVPNLIPFDSHHLRMPSPGKCLVPLKHMCSRK